MRLIVGLGNPGEKYAKTRHNLGFMVTGRLMQNSKSKSQNDNLKFKINKKFNAEIGKLGSEVMVIRPQTFMNASGIAVAKVAQFYKVDPENIWVIHDDVDLPLGKIKIRFGGAAAGHHGVESVIKELGTDKFVRFRLGIGHPGRGSDAQVEKYVLRPFDVNERSEVKQIVKKTVMAVKKALTDGIERAMNEFN